MSFLVLVLLVVLIGVVIGLVQRAPWIDPAFKTIIWWVGIVCVVVVILQAFGVLNLIRDVQVPRFGR